ncbi:methyltransferase domain-containing protein [Paenibacillus sp. MBLB2552]|uniref:Methyltransferase domain-containing protein n=1 Tax=Paenibacillus mellifer TaxID=2937794 RepID=A0A9X1XZY1_9BACL|nr:methyltransferase domain-containing protein [Paenibacillus mellifer]MCK8489025.1 methyltransferase domain-containing protein [Paenibacillus mellifer]
MEQDLKILNEIKRLYSNHGNIIEYFKKNSSSQANSTSQIMISYDFQAGSYIQHYRDNKELRDSFSAKLADVLNDLGSFDSLLEAGVGEAVTLGNTVSRLNFRPQNIYGFDLSWSRIKYAQQFLREFGISNASLFTGDLFCSPLRDNSVDVVYTVHSIEPNGGREREGLTELYRVARKYLVLVEPAYEFADEPSKQRMLAHGYITNLYETALQLGYEIIEHRQFEVSLNPLNPTGLIIIRKEASEESDPKTDEKSPICCPITKASIQRIKAAFYSPESMLAYPILDGIPCLLPQNAIVATHFMDFEQEEGE